MQTTDKSVIFIVGPTASGKSEAAYLLAKRIGGEIVSADSMQVYRKMDIATAKPPTEWTDTVPHHLMDIVEPTEEFDAGKFFQTARAIIAEIIARHKVPIVVGGTGLYVRCLLRGIFAGPGADNDLRQRLNNELNEYGVKYLYEKLKKIDPKTADSIDPDNPRRIIRALEVFYTAKKSITDMQVQWKETSSGIENDYRCVLIGLKRKREDLYERINRRVDWMFENGIIDECQRLISAGIEKNKVAMQALGYKDIISYLRDEITVEEAKEHIKQRTRNFAKRQITWFKKEHGIKWIDVEKNEKAENILRKMTNDK